MATSPQIQFPRAEYLPFFYEDTHLLYIIFQRESHRELYLIRDTEDASLQLDYPGALFEEKVRDAVDRVLLVEMSEDGGEPKHLALGTYFPVDDDTYGAYYERGTDEQTLFFMQIVGEGDTASLEAVVDPSEHARVSDAFMERYGNFFSVGQ
ncbi:MAG: DUF1292 domain-containing protein [Acidibacillus sp.]|uniref:Uncharacterized protein n=1 Tax=Sulfoacidibacillus ferrooxidans TaxID=2005001 RepID=A0A9X1V5P9_9BACL|nr:DUF1292 domain-containing protein [Sulfoacidibacillus ferrooxidans]MCI0181803.1 hypothetical protein [Sulfoacidibacillus ferrooxidans]MCY0892898.1 DUF1292 domain-containing protein [Acidibacillus sp.]